ncbi:SAM-dependent chlorinase/fluorinase [bacterium]|nr:SAM-dependent chlorinase/fluorinase [bacterium]
MDRPLITLLTDFGTRDGYVGALKGVLLTLCPAAQLVDITHEIGPGDIAEAAFVLESCCNFFPAGTVNLTVVDPGVGSHRRALALQSGGRWYVGPDNGVFEPLLSAGWSECRELTSPEHRRSEVSATFHGRDIFAPAAAFLAAGGEQSHLGPPVADPQRLAAPARPECAQGCLAGQVVHVDRFGNLITDIPLAEVRAFCPEPSDLVVELAGRSLTGLHTHYAQAAAGELLALTGSHGRLEIGANRASAANLLGGLLRGAAVQLRNEPS